MRVAARVYISAPDNECPMCDEDMDLRDIRPVSAPAQYIAFYECPICRAQSQRHFFVGLPKITED